MRLKPSQMLKNEYHKLYWDKGYSMEDIIKYFFVEESRYLSLDYLAEKMFETHSQEETRRTKITLSKVLRNGANKGLWTRTKRGVYCFKVSLFFTDDQKDQRNAG